MKFRFIWARIAVLLTSFIFASCTESTDKLAATNVSSNSEPQMHSVFWKICQEGAFNEGDCVEGTDYVLLQPNSQPDVFLIQTGRRSSAVSYTKYSVAIESYGCSSPPTSEPALFSSSILMVSNDFTDQIMIPVADVTTEAIEIFPSTLAGLSSCEEIDPVATE